MIDWKVVGLILAICLESFLNHVLTQNLVKISGSVNTPSCAGLGCMYLRI